MRYAILALLLSGCASTVPQEARTRIYDKTEQEARQAAVMYLEASGYTLDTAALDLGVIKGSQPFNTLTTVLVGSGRFELSFLIRETPDGQASVTMQPNTYSTNAFGVETRNNGSAKQVQEIVDNAFVEYTRIIGGGDMGTVASMEADKAAEAKELECLGDTSRAESRIIAYPNTPIYTQANSGSAISMYLAAGVKVMTFNQSGPFTQICYKQGRAWVKSDRIGRTR